MWQHLEIDDKFMHSDIIFDSRLSWNKYVQHVYISKGIGVIHRLKQYLLYLQRLR